ncbi:hypothetical protein Dsin_015903 [Dipteronia sinensis]|uniref:Reverse transcriptase n=1 Tax=Dipteronia sinensis TaxID=43782 RepID=A0AAE0ADA4_9ROSI|nr:hypothetical protein Dsin_015903 [Dipteronia sinensis]
MVIREIERKLDSLLEEEEVYWRQWSRVQWLKEGSRNTKFFHWKASTRRAQNVFKGLYDERGVWCEGRKGLEEVISGYFNKLFKADEVSFSDVATLIDCLQPLLSQRSSDFLYAPFTVEEVRKAVFDMAPTKASGPDGLPALFYQKFWDTFGLSATEVCLRCLNYGDSLKRVNNTLICFIPKKETADRMTVFRSISLCNVLYKAVAKHWLTCYD